MKTVTFQVLDGVDKGRVFRDLAIPVTIGREEGNVLRLNDERVSRYHAKVQQEDGDVILTDLDSTNGTRVNNNPVQIRRLRPGDQVSLGRSVLLFGSMEEIAARRKALKPSNVPQGQTLAGNNPADDLGFDLNLGEEPLPADDNVWVPDDKELPPLPLKLSPSQAARLAEILDFLHRGLTSAMENIIAPEDATEVRLPFAHWQTIQAVQMYLARYVRAISDPESLEK